MTDVYRTIYVVKHYLLGGGVANCPLHGAFLYTKKHLGNNLLSIIRSSEVSALEWLSCMDLIGKTIGTKRFVRYIEVSAIEGCPLRRVSLYSSLPITFDVALSKGEFCVKVGKKGQPTWLEVPCMVCRKKGIKSRVRGHSPTQIGGVKRSK